MAFSNAELQARWRVKRAAELNLLRQVAAEQAQHLIEARSEIEIAALERENATLKIALAHERKHAEAKARAAESAPPPIDLDEITRLKDKIRNLRSQLRYMKKWYEDGSRLQLTES